MKTAAPRRRAPVRTALTLALTACGTRRTAPSRAIDAAVSARAGAALAADTARPMLGPPDPWGDGAVPRSTATGPAVDAARATLTTLRASVGFWRIARGARDACPTLEQLADTPAAAFDPRTMRADPWGTPFEIDCREARVRVRSAGPDRAAYTADDLVVE